MGRNVKLRPSPLHDVPFVLRAMKAYESDPSLPSVHKKKILSSASAFVTALTDAEHARIQAS